MLSHCKGKLLDSKLDIELLLRLTITILRGHYRFAESLARDQPRAVGEIARRRSSLAFDLNFLNMERSPVTARHNEARFINAQHGRKLWLLGAARHGR